MRFESTWSGKLTAAQRNQAATFCAGLAPEALDIRGLSLIRDENSGEVVWILRGAKAAATVADLPLGQIVLIER
jgi:hypothetical protein